MVLGFFVALPEGADSLAIRLFDIVLGSARTARTTIKIFASLFYFDVFKSFINLSLMFHIVLPVSLFTL